MTLPRASWFVVNGIPLMAIALLGLVTCLIGWDWLEEKCAFWFESINRTRPLL
jgi:hypothetical protein